MSSIKKWSIFISGRGSNLKALIDKKPNIDIALVVSSKKEAPGIKYAVEKNIPVLIFEKNDSWSELTEKLKKLGVTNIFLAGFMKILPKSFIDSWQNQILNLHPSLLPAYPGLKSIERAYRDKADIGVTVHFVTPEVDAGKILLQSKVVSASDLSGLTLEKVEELVHQKEHELVKKAVELV